MRLVALAGSLLLLGAVACGTHSGDDDADSDSADLTSKNPRTVGTPCSVPRDQLLADASPARQHALQRGFKWLDDNVPYSQAASHEGYRTDCSGFVSMCWDLGKSSNTSALYGGDSNENLKSWTELLPADAVVKRGHVMLFVGFNGDDKSGICVLEQSSTKNDMQFRMHTVSSLKGEGYKPIRADKLAKDLGGGAGSVLPSAGGGANDDSAKTGDDDTSDNGAPSSSPSPASKASSDPQCVPVAPAVACQRALAGAGIECGVIKDGCGGTIDCDKVPSFGCMPDETCNANRQCVPNAPPPPPTCTPKTAADACGAAKTIAGVTCGVISDGCSGTVSCDGVPGFGCAATEVCTPKHTCEPTAPPSPPPSSSAATPAPDPAAVTPTSNEPGDQGDPDDEANSAKPPAKPKPKSSSGGCSATPAGGPAGGGLPLLGVLAALSGLRRRKRVA